MKKILLACLAIFPLIISNCGHSGNTDSSKGPGGDTSNAKIVFREYEHSFGKVTEGEKIGYVFIFENKGTSNLVIASATTSCGCTVPEYDTKPIAPGATGKIEVVFNTSGRDGMQTKTITVKSNAKPPVVLLKITAEVVPAK